MDIKPARDIFSWNAASQRAYFLHVRICQFGKYMALAAIVRTVGELI